MKKHLLGGVAKGAFTEAEAAAKFEAWKNNKQSGLATLKAKLDEAKKAEAKARLEAEKKVNEAVSYTHLQLLPILVCRGISMFPVWQEYCPASNLSLIHISMCIRDSLRTLSRLRPMRISCRKAGSRCL